MNELQKTILTGIITFVIGVVWGALTAREMYITNDVTGEDKKYEK